MRFGLFVGAEDQMLVPRALGDPFVDSVDGSKSPTRGNCLSDYVSCTDSARTSEYQR